MHLYYGLYLVNASCILHVHVKIVYGLSLYQKCMFQNFAIDFDHILVKTSIALAF